MADHRIGLGDRRPCPPARPRQRIERQAIADRRIAGDQEALLACAGTTARCASGRGRWLRAPPAAPCRPASRDPVRTRARAARAPSGPWPCWHRPRRSTAAAARATGSTRCPRRHRTGSRDRAAAVRRRPARSVLGDRRRGAGRLGTPARSAPDRARSARRPCASSSPAPSAAAARRDTICPGRSAAAALCANRSASLRNSTPASRRFSGPSAAVFHSAPSMSSIDTKVGSPPMVSCSPALAMSRSIASPTPSSFCHCSSV